ncbi:hypothetical protein SAICODRAFT_24686 [Saitoella complicata NRRL Y-17804]|uniref:Tuberous sclerosis 1 n=1 Tax=Saitoella complicata (strain BCRC 22490 / CBS 7301 / JCM 7358 / NBRC 10748 / NRRL Y-17804) TaxID=698492 RepID=A0A0E9NAP9_SAICN|nr:uncharacterized protein SAICODRAFT_24686 [Saitoella complicata NRRL Y-17804]ODQ53913.1 hypothetical protein SAICODRAFT_24686 [Saitoella complicata NRRL Y-17804]GAO46873.1 hypothetical protein G7K_1091-t1 [Saitoella complicata NRRL Y-17804]
MSGASLKDLSKALNGVFLPTPPSLPLSDDLHATMEAYLSRHPTPTSDESPKLQDELIQLHAKFPSTQPSPAFLTLLKTMQPSLAPEAMLKWWELLFRPIYEKSVDDAQSRVVLDITHDILFTAMENGTDGDESTQTTRALRKRILDLYFPSLNPPISLEKLILAYAKLHPKAFFNALGPHFTRAQTRTRTLTLLTAYIQRNNGSGLHHMFATNLWNLLLESLERDDSEAAVQLGVGVLCMSLPHVANSLADFLPRLYGIYYRLLCWDRVVRRGSLDSGIESGDDNSHSESVELVNASPSNKDEYEWKKLEADAASAMPPPAAALFTFLYGLFPVNLFKFFRDPATYLASYPDSALPTSSPLSRSTRAIKELDEDMLRSRSAAYVRRHLLHTNFLMFTPEQERADVQRWMRNEVGGIVAECVGLDTWNLAGGALPYMPALNDTVAGLAANEMDSPVLGFGKGPGSGSLLSPLESEADTEDVAARRPSIAQSLQGQGHGQGLSISIPNASQNLMEETAHHLASPVFQQGFFAMSPPEQSSFLATSPKHVRDFVHIDKTLKSLIPRSRAVSVDRSAKPDLEGALSDAVSGHVGSPDLSHAGTSDQQTIAHLQRELLLLRNELNFERHLKSQHLQHIGRLQREHILDSSVEMERQNLYNTTRALKSKVVELTSSLNRQRSEAMATKTARVKWEGELGSKIKTIREDRKSWKAEEESLRSELEARTKEAERLRRIVEDAERDATALAMKLKTVEPDVKEFNQLKEQVESIDRHRQDWEDRRNDLTEVQNKLNREEAEKWKLKGQLRSMEQYLERALREQDDKVRDLEAKLLAAQGGPSPPVTPPAKITDLIENAQQAYSAELDKLRNAQEELQAKCSDLQARNAWITGLYEQERVKNGKRSKLPVDDFSRTTGAAPLLGDSREASRRPSLETGLAPPERSMSVATGSTHSSGHTHPSDLDRRLSRSTMSSVSSGAASTIRSAGGSQKTGLKALLPQGLISEDGGSKNKQPTFRPRGRGGAGGFTKPKKPEQTKQKGIKTPVGSFFDYE